MKELMKLRYTDPARFSDLMRIICEETNTKQICVNDEVVFKMPPMHQEKEPG